MAHSPEPMEVDSVDSEFDNKENTYHHTNVLPCTEKGYEELDVSELNMKLRYSTTPVPSPMSKSYTTFVDSRSLDNDSLNSTIENANLTRSLNSTMTKNDIIIKSLKSRPLQTIATEPIIDNSSSVLRQQLDSIMTRDDKNVTVTLSAPIETDENISFPSTSSSAIHTPEVTTPTNIKNDEGSPIIRGLKSVFNMFRSSQSPIPPTENDNSLKQEVSALNQTTSEDQRPPNLASTPISDRRSRDGSTSKRSSPLKDSIVFNDDLEKELQWKEDTILFSEEKIPLHKLFLHQPKPIPTTLLKETTENKQEQPIQDMNATVEFMDISYDNSIRLKTTITETQQYGNAGESDGEFVDCETTFTNKQHENEIKDGIETVLVTDALETHEKLEDIKQIESIPNMKNEYENKQNLIKKEIKTVNTTDIVVNENKIRNATSEITNIDRMTSVDNVAPDIITQEILLENVPSIDNTFINKEHENETKDGIQTVPVNVALELDEKFKDQKQMESIPNTNENVKSLIEKEMITVNTTDIVVNENIIRDAPSEIKIIERVTSVNNVAPDIIPQEILLDNVPSIDNTFTNKEHENETKDEIQTVPVNIALELYEQLEDKKQMESIPNTNENEKSLIDKETETLKTPDHVTNDNEMKTEAPSEIKENEQEISVDTVTLDIMTQEISFENDPSTDSTKHIPLKNVSTEVNKIKDNLLTDADKTLNITIEMFTNEDIPNHNNIIATTNDTVQEDLPADTANVPIEEVPPLGLDSKETASESPLDHHKAYNNEESNAIIRNMEETRLKEEITNDNIAKLNQANRKNAEDISLTDENNSDIAILDESKSRHMKNENSNSDIYNVVSESDIKSASSEDIDIERVNKESQNLTSESDQTKTENVIEHAVETRSEKVIFKMTHGNNDITFPNSVTKPEKTLKSTSDEVLPVSTVFAVLANEPANIPLPNDDTINLSNYVTELDEMGKPILSEVLLVNTANVAIADEPANIPLPDNNDIGINMDNFSHMKKVGSIDIPPDVLDTTNESKLDVIVSIDKILDETTHLDILEKTIGQLELPPSENQNLFNETNEIVNSLNGIIGESPNSTKSDGMLEQSTQNNVEPIEIIECTNETHTLPDLVNLTISQTNIAIGGESQMANQHKYVMNTETIKETHNLPSEPETIFNVSEAKSLKSDALDVSMSNDDIEKCNEPIIKNKEHTKVTVEQTGIIDAVPMAQEETKVDETDNRLKYIEIQAAEVVPEVAITQVTVPILDEELVLSENNSPYVSVISETETKPEQFEEVNMVFTQTAVPSSPPIHSKGYNFNFDEMDDPFAIKTKIGQPSPPTQSKIIERDNANKNDFFAKKVVPNRRTSQHPERKKSAMNRNKLNTTFASGAGSGTNSSNDRISEGNSAKVTVDMSIKETNSKENSEVVINSTNFLDKTDEGNIVDDQEKNVSAVLLEQNVTPAAENATTSTENKSSFAKLGISTSEIKTSSSEQSTYYSAAGSSSDSSQSRNVFNLPEIEDLTFNPFATKLKLRQSPTLEFSGENSFASKSKIKCSPDSSLVVLQNNQKIQVSQQSYENTAANTAVMVADTSHNIGNSISSLKTSNDIHNTSREINTEDEDTEEGPFLEAEDTIDRILEKENVDMLQFNEMPTQANDENVDGGELFIDAEAFEFLLNQNKSNVVADSGKESLFLKFDPLFAKRISSDGVLAALSKIQKRQSTPAKPIKSSIRHKESPVAGPSAFDATYDGELNLSQERNEDQNATVTKPMMVVTPAVNPAVTPRNKATTPTRSNRRSVIFTSPAMAVIDRLISLSGNSSVAGHDTTFTQPSRDPDEADVALTQLRELLAEKEISVYQLRAESKELKDRLSTMEAQMKIIDASNQERLQKINELNDLLIEKAKINKRMAAVVEEYEKTIASLIAEIEQDKKRHADERIKLINERDEQTAHLASMEVSFSDLHSKYEKSKQVILSYKANSETCRKSIKEFQENLTKMQTNYEALKQHATSKLNYANQELENINKAHESEVLKLNAMMKRKDMHITSLEETLAQKTKANDELTAICDELINKVG